MIVAQTLHDDAAIELGRRDDAFLVGLMRPPRTPEVQRFSPKPVNTPNARRFGLTLGLYIPGSQMTVTFGRFVSA